MTMMGESSSSSSSRMPRTAPVLDTDACYDSHTLMNMALLDPPRFGWAAVGGVVDVLTPHERARRESTRVDFLKSVQQFGKEDARTSGGATDDRPKNDAGDGGIHSNTESPAVVPMPPRPTDASGNRSSVSIQGPQQPMTTDYSDEHGASSTILSSSGDTRGSSRDADTCGERPSLSDSHGVKSMPSAAFNGDESSSGPSLIMSFPSARAVSTTLAEPQLEHTFGSAEPIVAQIGGPSSSLDEHTQAPAPIMEDTTETSSVIGSANKDQASPTGSKRDFRKKKTVHVTAMNDAGVLDMYTYHRGREGIELRDKETGCLLCEEEKTDTNHDWEPPKLCTTVTVSFPLTSDENITSRGKSDAPFAQKGSGGVLEFREKVKWDLSDPTTLTPLAFATKAAEEFGLSFGQTLDLASSIQKQLDTFVQRRVLYAPPVTLNDPYGNLRTLEALSAHVLSGPVQLYGGVNAEISGGLQLPREFHTVSTAQASEIAPVELIPEGRAAAVRISLPSEGDPPVEPKYRNEVQRRAKQISMAEIRQIALDRGDAIVGALIPEGDLVCHICRSRCRRCARFACGIATHVFCSNHLSGRHDIHIDGNTSALLEFCPICSLTCYCAKCARRLEAVAFRLSEKAVEQDTEPHKTVLDDFSALCKRASVGYRKSVPKAPEQKRPIARIPKVPASEFPREVCGGRDLDPGTAEDYRTVFSIKGIFVRNDLGESSSVESQMRPPGPPTPSNEVPEDGSVDYCNVCLKAGNLFCCDRCPRAYHIDCMQEKVAGEDDRWECHMCEQEKIGVPDDIVNGEESIEAILACCTELKHSDGLLKSVRILAMIHQMLSKLISYDFGHIFQSPVDPRLVPGYDKIIKNPMDIGTIRTKLVDGSYVRISQSNNSWDDVIVAVLKDIELVWHNCFTFNFEGSSVYRMAEVQRRKCIMIQKCSFDQFLSDSVKDRVSMYVKQCKEQREKIIPRTTATARSPDCRARGKNKITVPMSVGRTARSVAVLDPGTGLLVKIYTTIKAACLAATFLAGLGHAVEVQPFTEGTLRSVLRKSHADARTLLFGYRWLYLDDLLGRKVRFPGDSNEQDMSNDRLSTDFVNMRDGDFSYLYVSIEEALCCPDLPTEIPLDEIRKRLEACPVGEWRSIVGRRWKRVSLPRASLLPKASNQSVRENYTPGIQKPILADATILKEDLISRCVLLGFDDVKSAHHDWLCTRKGSPVLLPEEQENIEYFRTYYLEGPRTVNGIIWRQRACQTAKGTCDVDTHNENVSLLPTSKLHVDIVNNRPKLVSAGKEPLREVPGVAIDTIDETQLHFACAESENVAIPNSPVESVVHAGMPQPEDPGEDNPLGEPTGLVLNPTADPLTAEQHLQRTKREREVGGAISEDHRIAKKKAINV